MAIILHINSPHGKQILSTWCVGGGFFFIIALEHREESKRYTM